jgi:hypothetical protein
VDGDDFAPAFLNIFVLFSRRWILAVDYGNMRIHLGRQTIWNDTHFSRRAQGGKLFSNVVFKEPALLLHRAFVIFAIGLFLGAIEAVLAGDDAGPRGREEGRLLLPV